jgi:hypothetical protein
MRLAILLANSLLVTTAEDLDSTWSRSTTVRCAWTAVDANPDDTTHSAGFGLGWLLGMLRGANTPSRRLCAAAADMPLSHACVSAEFSAPLPKAPSCRLLLAARPLDACTALDFHAMLRDQPSSGAVSLGADVTVETVAVLAVRGGCSFATKAHHAATLGAAVLIVADGSPGAIPMPMAGDPSTPAVSTRLVSVMVGADADLEALLAALANTTVCYTTTSDLGDSSDSGSGAESMLATADVGTGTAAVLFASLVLACRWALSPADTRHEDEGGWAAAVGLATWLAAVSWVRQRAPHKQLFSVRNDLLFL